MQNIKNAIEKLESKKIKFETELNYYSSLNYTIIMDILIFEINSIDIRIKQLLKYLD